MGKRIYTDSKHYEAIANSLRKRFGENEKFKPADMAPSIDAIDATPILQEKMATVNGDVIPDEGYDGLSKVTVNIETKLSLQDKTITENGTYTADEGYDGLSKVSVNVSSRAGNIQPLTITKNGTYDGSEGAMFSTDSTLYPNDEAAYRAAASGELDILVNVQGGMILGYKSVDMPASFEVASLQNEAYFLEATVGNETQIIQFADYEWGTVIQGNDIGIAVPTDTAADMMALLCQIVVDADVFAGAGVLTPVTRAAMQTKCDELGITLTDAYTGTWKSGSAYVLAYYAGVVQVQVNACLPGLAGYDGYMPVTVDIQPNLQEKTVTANGTVSPDAGYDGLSSVTVEVAPNLQDKTVTKNGAYTADEGYDGLSSVVVEVDESFKNYIEGKSTAIAIPSGATSIRKSAFSDNDIITSVTIPESVISIGGHAFDGCDKLTSVTMSEGLTSIGTAAFQKCINLNNVIIPDTVKSIGTYAFCTCEKLSNITIPDGVTSIEERVFSACIGLESITIPNSVTSIGIAAFYKCNKLTGTIAIPDGSTSVENYTFSSCDSLTGVTIPDSVTSIGTNAFENCRGLTSITIPAGVTSIGNYAFQFSTANTSSFAEFHFKPTTPPSIGTSAFKNFPSTCAIYVPYSEDHSVLAAYQAKAGLANVVSQIVEEPASGTESISK